MTGSAEPTTLKIKEPEVNEGDPWRDAARDLRDTMVAQAPDTVQRSGNTVQHKNCLVARKARLRANEERARELMR